MFLQVLEVCMFSILYNVIMVEELGSKGSETRKEWLELAKLGANFLRDKGKDSNGHFYFTLDRQGNPLIAPYSIFSDCFAAMAFAQYAKATKEQWAVELAKQTFENIEKRKSNPKGQWTKAIPGSRPYKGLSIPMIDINLCLEMKEAIPSLEVDERINKNIDLVLNNFLDPRGFLRENISEKPEVDSFDSRLVNPGHTIEALWFIMDAASKRGRNDIVQKAADNILKTLEFGWDQKFGGIFYFMDTEGKPPQQLEWDQKLWWVHVETLVALSLAYQLTNREEFAKWYELVHEWSWSHFHDTKHGEWFGYLNRRGEVLLELKGGKWKGFFHMPRAMLLCSQIFKKIANKK